MQEKGETMAKVYVFFAEGMEEVEALTPVDLLRRAGAEVVTVSMMEEKTVKSAHGIRIEADILFKDGNFEDGDMFCLPGGPGHKILKASKELKDLFVNRNQEGKRIAAICASPSVLNHYELLDGKKAVAHPTVVDQMDNVDLQEVPFVTDGLVTTGRGLGAAFDYSFELVRLLLGEEAMEKVKKEIVWQH